MCETAVRRFEASETDGLTAAVVDALAALRGVNPIDLDRPLADAVDPEALTAFVWSGGGDADHLVTFCHDRDEVTVTAAGVVRAVRPCLSPEACRSEVRA